MEGKIRLLLDEIKHPESGVGVHDGGFVESITIDEGKIKITLRFEKVKDPFALKIKRRVEEMMRQHFPSNDLLVVIKEGVAPRKVDPAKVAENNTTTKGVAHTIAVASGKGGVGKSTVTTNLAVQLAGMGYKVGLIDADIYGPSQPKMFGLEGQAPEITGEEGSEMFVPLEKYGVKVISIGFFIKVTDALVWRGPIATNALKQIIHQSSWGALDYLLIDLPPGTGDIHLTLLSELKFTGAVIVSTPQKVALADVVRGIEMFRAKQINVPILGVVENMAWFTPAELPENKYYIFGKEGAAELAREQGVELLAQIPIVQSMCEGGDCGIPDSLRNPVSEAAYRTLAENIIKVSNK